MKKTAPPIRTMGLAVVDNEALDTGSDIGHQSHALLVGSDRAAAFYAHLGVADWLAGGIIK